MYHKLVEYSWKPPKNDFPVYFSRHPHAFFRQRTIRLIYRPDDDFFLPLVRGTDKKLDSAMKITLVRWRRVKIRINRSLGISVFFFPLPFATWITRMADWWIFASNRCRSREDWPSKRKDELFVFEAGVYGVSKSSPLNWMFEAIFLFISRMMGE